MKTYKINDLKGNTMVELRLQINQLMEEIKYLYTEAQKNNSTKNCGHIVKMLTTLNGLIDQYEESVNKST